VIAGDERFPAWQVLKELQAFADVVIGADVAAQKEEIGRLLAEMFEHQLRCLVA
jgi:hypothetical protein